MGDDTHKHKLETTISVFDINKKRLYLTWAVAVALLIGVFIVAIQPSKTPAPIVKQPQEQEAVKVEEPTKLTDEQIRNNEAYRNTNAQSSVNKPALQGAGE